MMLTNWIKIEAFTTQERRAQLKRMRDAWKSGEWGLANEHANQAIAMGIDSNDVVQMRLRTAVKIGDADKIAEAGPAGAAVDAALALTGVRALIKSGHLLQAAAIMAELARNPSAANLELYEPSVQRLSKQLISAGDRLVRDGASAEGYAHWNAAGMIDPANSGPAKRLLKAKRDAVKRANDMSIDVDAQAYADAWREVVAIDPADPRPYKRLAIGSEKCDQNDFAAACWSRIMVLEPDNDVAPSRYARATVGSDDPAAALALIADHGVVNLAESQIARLAKRVAAKVSSEIKNENYVAAAKALHALVRVNYTDDTLDKQRQRVVRALSAQARDLQKSGDPKEVVELCDLVLAIDPQNARSLSTLARTAYKLRAYDVAEQALQRLIAIEPDVERNRDLLTRVQAGRGAAILN